jgi:hypothetical protein
MQREFALAGFVISGDEWDSLDETARAQLLAVALQRDGAWGLAIPPRAMVQLVAEANDAVPEPIDGPEPYAHYELLPAAA